MRKVMLKNFLEKGVILHTDNHGRFIGRGTPEGFAFVNADNMILHIDEFEDNLYHAINEVIVTGIDTLTLDGLVPLYRLIGDKWVCGLTQKQYAQQVEALRQVVQYKIAKINSTLDIEREKLKKLEKELLDEASRLEEEFLKESKALAFMAPPLEGVYE